jgi:hypothetical protein
MIVFISASASDIAGYLRESKAKGFMGVYDSKDECALRQAAALAGARVFVLNTFLLRLSLGGIVIASCLMLTPGAMDAAHNVFLASLAISLSSIALEKATGKRKSSNRTRIKR